MTLEQSLLFWGFLLAYGGLIYALSPRSRNAASFYRGAERLACNDAACSQHPQVDRASSNGEPWARRTHL